jgi:hypothetical protein
MMTPREDSVSPDEEGMGPRPGGLEADRARLAGLIGLLLARHWLGARAEVAGSAGDPEPERGPDGGGVARPDRIGPDLCPGPAS